MHGSRPDLFQLRQLFLAAVITAGAIAIIAGVTFCAATSGFSLSPDSSMVSNATSSLP